MAREIKIEVSAETRQALRLVADLFDGIVQGAARAVASQSKTAAAAQALASKMRGTTLAAGGLALGITSVVAGLGVLAYQFARSLQGLTRLSASAGLTAQNFTALEKVFSKSGLSTEEMGKKLRDLAKRGAEVDPIFRSLGVSVFTTNGSWKTSGELLVDLADKFRDLPDGIEKTNLATKLFGENGDRMIPILNQGTLALRQQSEEAIRSGATIDNATAQRISMATQRLTKVRSSLTEFLNPLKNAFARTYSFFVETLASILERVSEFGAKLANSPAGQAVKKFFDGLFPSSPTSDRPKPPALLNPEETYALSLEKNTLSLQDNETEGQRIRNPRMLAKNLRDKLAILNERLGTVDPQLNELRAQAPSKGLAEDSAGIDKYRRDFAENLKQQIPVLEEKAKIIREIGDAQERLIALESPLSEGLGRYVEQWTGAQAVATTTVGAIDTALTGLGDAVTGLILQTRDWAQNFARAGQAILSMVVQLIVKFTVLSGFIALLGVLFPGSSFVGNLRNFAGLGSKADGGYTGDGGRNEPAGIYHRGEFYFGQNDVRRVGLATLQNLRRGIIGDGVRTPQFALGGGPVGAPGLSRRPQHFFIVQDMAEVRRHVLQHPDAENIIVNVAGKAGFRQS